MSKRPTKLIIVLCCAILYIANADAADYSAGFAIGAAASSNDNIRLTQNDQTSVRKYDISPTLTLGVNTETTKAQLSSAFDFNHYDKSEFDSNDQNIALDLSRQFESSSLGMNASYIHNSTITSELLTTGRIGNKAERAEQYSLSPNWSYLVTENNQIQLIGTYTKQNYESNAYIGYKNTGAELDWVHLVSARTKLIAAATYSKYQSDDISLAVPAVDVFVFPYLFPTGYFGDQSYATEIKSKGLQAGIEYQWSEQSLVKARLGRSQNRTSYPVSDPHQICTQSLYNELVAVVGPIGSACNLQASSGLQSTSELDWIWSNERQQFNLSASKTIQPTGNGYAVDATQVKADWNYRLSELNKISVGTSLVRNRAIDNKSSLQNITLADRDYGSATLGYQRQLSEYWLLNASFQFTDQKYTQTNYQASSRVYTLGVSYRPQQWHWAR